MMRVFDAVEFMNVCTRFLIWFYTHEFFVLVGSPAAIESRYRTSFAHKKKLRMYRL